MNTYLVVTRAFGPYAKSDIIADPTCIQSILASDHACDVVAVEASHTAQKNATPEKEA